MSSRSRTRSSTVAAPWSFCRSTSTSVAGVTHGPHLPVAPTQLSVSVAVRAGPHYPLEEQFRIRREHLF